MILVNAARREDFYMDLFYIVVMVGFGKQFLAIMVKLKRGPLCMSSEATSHSSFIPVVGGGMTLRRFSDRKGIFCKPWRPGSGSAMGEVFLRAFWLLAQANGTALMLLQTLN